MGRRRFTVEEIIAKLREVEALVARGATAVETCAGSPELPSRRSSAGAKRMAG